MTQQEFIDKIAPLHIKYAKKYGFKIVSAAIAQACLESAYGTSYKAQHNNFYGLKYRQNRVTVNNGTFIDKSSEQNPDGSYIPITDQWFNFDTMEAGVEGYYQFINISNYAKVKEAITPQKYLEEIVAAKYATSLNYVQNNLNVIKKWDLTKYDQKENKTNMDIIQKNGTANTTARKKPIQWIVLHYTAGTSSKKGAARNVAAYFSKITTRASADFICDDGEIVQYNANPLTRYCWSVGGSLVKPYSTSLAAKYHNICTNANSISIEMCSNKISTKSLKASDNDWYLTDATINNAVELTKYLMKIYGIDIDHVIMHHMVTGKWCPQPWVKNEAALANWRTFLAKVKNTASQVTPAPAPATVNYVVKINTAELNVRKGPGTSYAVTTKVTQNQKFTIIEEQNGWGKLKSGAGWINLEYTIKEGTNQPPVADSSYWIQVTASSLNMRSGPGTQYPITGTLKAGDKYIIGEEQNGWGNIKLTPNWIKLSYTKKI